MATNIHNDDKSKKSFPLLSVTICAHHKHAIILTCLEGISIFSILEKCCYLELQGQSESVITDYFDVSFNIALSLAYF